MGKPISTVLSIVDNMTAPMMSIQHAVGMLETRFNALNNAVDLDASTTQAMKNALAMADSSARVLEDNMKLVAANAGAAETKQRGFTAALGQGNIAAGGLLGKIGGIVAAYASVRTLGKAIGLSDSLAGIDARLNLIARDGESVAEINAMIMASANDARASYLDTAAAVAKLGINAGKAFGSTAHIVKFTELMNKNFVIAGASASEASNATYQLTQAMASGRLQGDEYRSIIENAPLLKNAIEDYMTNVVKATGTLKDWASKGKLTADVINNSLMNAADEIEKRFKKMPKTWGQVWTLFKNDAIEAFRPVLTRLNELANSPEFETFRQNAVSALTGIAEAALGMVNGVVAAVNWMADNWDKLKYVLWGVVGALVAVKVAAVAANIVMTATPIGLLITAIGFLIGLLVQWSASLIGLKATWLIVKNSFLMGWEAIKIEFMTGIYGIQTLFDNIALAWKKATTGIVNQVGAFKSEVLLRLERLVNESIAIINGFIMLLNKIPGVNIDFVGQVNFGTSAMVDTTFAQAARNNELAAYEEEINAAKAERDAKLDAMKAEIFSDQVERVTEIARAVAQYKGAAYEDYITRKELADEAYNAANNNSLITSILETIAGNTAKTADYSEEELKLWRDVAERDVINRFTTAEVSVNFGGITQNVSSGLDLDGIVDYIAEGVEESLYVAAEGVYA
jgi:tape measure domain-containing protein